jgi:hypothetical protein
MFRIITIERQYGCGAADIARKLANQPGWSLWDERPTAEIARLSHRQQSDVRIREEKRSPGLRLQPLDTVENGGNNAIAAWRRKREQIANALIRLTI